MMFSRFSKIVLLSVLTAVFVFWNFSGFAQENVNIEALDFEKICESMEEIEKVCATLNTIECRGLLEKCEKYFEEKVTQIGKEITKTEQEKKTLSNKINVLKKEIESLNYKIYQNNLAVKGLKLQIEDTQNSIDRTSSKVGNSENQLKKILREIYEKEDRSVLEMFLKEEKFSDFFGEIFYLETLSLKMQTLLENIKELKTYLEGQKKTMDEEKEDIERLVKIQALQTAESEKVKKEKELLLKFTEAEYQKYLKEKETTQKKVAEIRSRIFELIGVSEAPTFGEALDVAKSVASMVNIRPAFLLAIISQESAIGRNVGQCVLTDPVTGAGKKISTGLPVSRLMKPTRDVQPFLKITAALGRDPYNTPVSCPLSVGYGGAMGPAQFIPSTWNLYYDKLQNVLGRSGNPWAIIDSFTAAGLYLSDLGASAKTAGKEKSAASQYYGGSSGYASSVMTRATCIQNFIDSGTMSSYCESLIF